MLVGAVGGVFTVTACVAQSVVLLQGELPTLRTQYVVFVVGLTVIEELVCPEMILLPQAPVPH